MRQMLIGSTLAVALLLSGCESTVVHKQTQKDYVIGKRSTVNVGGPIFMDQQGTYASKRVWIGVLNSPDGWQTNTSASPDFRMRELMYGGISGTTIRLNYREFRGHAAGPPMYQPLTYDLALSKVIRFQNFTIEVIDASNNSMTYVVLSDGTTGHPPTNSN